MMRPTKWRRHPAGPAARNSIELADDGGDTSLFGRLADARRGERERPFDSAVCDPTAWNVLRHLIDELVSSAEDLYDDPSPSSDTSRAAGVEPLRLHHRFHPCRVICSILQEREDSSGVRRIIALCSTLMALPPIVVRQHRTRPRPAHR